MPRPYTEKRKKSNQKWDAENLDRISIALPKGRKDIIKAHIAERNERLPKEEQESMNAFIIRSIDNQIERDNANQ